MANDRQMIMAHKKEKENDTKIIQGLKSENM